VNRLCFLSFFLSFCLKFEIEIGLFRDATVLGGAVSLDAHETQLVAYGVDEYNAVRQLSTLTLFEFDANFTLLCSGSSGPDSDGRIAVDLPGVAVVNDICTTAHYAIVIQPRIVVATNPWQFALNKDAGTALRWDSRESSTLHLIPRVGTDRARYPRHSMPIPMVLVPASKSSGQRLGPIAARCSRPNNGKFWTRL
jgi:Retinal pigment epithelial membrane protein